MNPSSTFGWWCSPNLPMRPRSSDRRGSCLDRLAVPIPNEHTQRYEEKANRHWESTSRPGHFLEMDPNWPGHVFNTTCLIGPTGLLTKYRKVHPWTPWEAAYQPARSGRLHRAALPRGFDRDRCGSGRAICYDWLSLSRGEFGN